VGRTDRLGAELNLLQAVDHLVEATDKVSTVRDEETVGDLEAWGSAYESRNWTTMGVRAKAMTQGNREEGNV
jgi:hypothetical protein